MHKDETPSLDIEGVDGSAIARRAREIWEAREQSIWGGPHFARQTWEQGTALARERTIYCAAYELYPDKFPALAGIDSGIRYR